MAAFPSREDRVGLQLHCFVSAVQPPKLDNQNYKITLVKPRVFKLLWRPSMMGDAGRVRLGGRAGIRSGGDTPAHGEDRGVRPLWRPSTTAARYAVGIRYKYTG